MKMTMIMSILMFFMIMVVISQKVMSLGAILLLSALLITIMLTLFTNSWYAFILFLIYITGLLVLFGYFLALSPNLHQTSKKCFKSYLILSLPVVLNPMTSFTKLPPFKMNFESMVISLMSKSNMIMYWFMAIVLLLALLMVVSLTFKSPSPLRKYLN